VDRVAFLTVLGLFAASTALYAVLGVRFDATTVSAMQFIDQPLLKERFAESIWYYHATPPMLNIITGAGLKIFGQHAPAFYSALFHVLGFLAALCVHELTRWLSRSRFAAVITTALLLFSPSFVVAENNFFYDFPAMALITGATLALYQFVLTRRTGWCVALFSMMGALLLTRSVFHLVFMLAVVVFLIALLRPHWRQIVMAAAVPFLIVTIWYGKNYLLVGKFGASSWMGLGLYNITTMLVPPRDLQSLIEKGELSPWAAISRYDNRGYIFRAQLRPPVGAPVIDNITKEHGVANWNYRDIAAIDRYYTADALTVIRKLPATYVQGLFHSNRLYFAPTSTGPYWLPSNMQATQAMERLFSPLLSGITTEYSGSVSLGPLGFPDEVTGPAHMNWLLMGAWLATFSWAYLVFRRVQTDPAARSDPAVVTMGFLVFLGAYNYVVGTAVEMGENYRYRFLIEPLFFVLAASAITAAVRAVRSRARSQVE
jgi:hypothetical protein